jgi:membrane bound O-acyltransferase family protein/DCC1-like thiol-disulfide oxidoreductase
VFEPLQGEGVAEMLGISVGEIPDEMKLRTREGRILGGADAAVYIARRIWWAWPIWLMSRIPGGMPMMRRGYRFVARRRHRISRACALPNEGDSPFCHCISLNTELSDKTVCHDRFFRYVAPLTIIAAGWLIAARLPAAWMFMWLLAVAIFVACKWVTWWPHRRRGTIARSVAYFFAWPGMDAKAFFAPRSPTPLDARGHELAESLLHIALGTSLIWLAPRGLLPLHPMLAGWCVMIGLVLLLHFGLLAIIAILWRRARFDLRPLMDHPLRSRSLAEFWGRRWNSGFNSVAREMLFAPLRRCFGPLSTTAAVFLASGIVHDIVVSVPARGGYGLPTLYFVIQLLGMLIQRTSPARRAGFARGTLGRIYTLTFTAAPLPLLFHEPFVRQVILPMACAIGTS